MDPTAEALPTMYTLDDESCAVFQELWNITVRANKIRDDLLGESLPWYTFDAH